MKLECPYCWQHYEIEKSAPDREVVCIYCEQHFLVKDALVLEKRSAQSRFFWPVIGGILLIVLCLAGVNIWLAFRSFAPPPEEEPVQIEIPELKAAGDLQTVMEPLYRTLKDFRKGIGMLSKQQTALQSRMDDLVLHIRALEKQPAGTDAADKSAKNSSPEKEIRALEARIQLLEEYHKQLLKGLTGLRKEAEQLRAGERLMKLERQMSSGAGSPMPEK